MEEQYGSYLINYLREMNNRIVLLMLCMALAVPAWLSGKDKVKENNEPINKPTINPITGSHITFPPYLTSSADSVRTKLLRLVEYEPVYAGIVILSAVTAVMGISL